MVESLVDRDGVCAEDVVDTAASKAANGMGPIGCEASGIDDDDDDDDDDDVEAGAGEDAMFEVAATGSVKVAAVATAAVVAT